MVDPPRSGPRCRYKGSQVKLIGHLSLALGHQGISGFACTLGMHIYTKYWVPNIVLFKFGNVSSNMNRHTTNNGTSKNFSHLACYLAARRIEQN